ncbi:MULTISPECIES: hypothetical protein [unclassified Chryseobacterium]|uniref:hypothetical protein n=1 Tax=unclassified Chryseobacterium TaxID=2593645 RepID=UPI00155B22B6|nr:MULTISPECIES: hypothetical protein [unclassified Chryseobacterium]MBO9693007.1 hypothetical protein [Chryseobacterium sp.]
MKNSNLKRLNRQEQKGIHGGAIKKCGDDSDCGPYNCCTNSVCTFIPTSECGPI